MGEIQIMDPTDTIIVASTGLYSTVLARAQEKVNNARISDRNFIQDIKDTLDFRVEYQGNTYTVSYINGRKDIALANMLDQEYISNQEAKQAFIKGLDYSFKSSKFNIEAPHFVHWITEILEETYDTETLFKGGFTVKTTLDLDIQKQAEEFITANYGNIQEFEGNNQAMIYLDSQNGDILAYI